MVDYTKRLNRIAESAGMFDFTKFKPLYQTGWACKKYIAVLDKYFSVRKLPVLLILGDAKPIRQIIKWCPGLAKIETCSAAKLADKDLSDYRNCTILVVGNKMIDTLRLETQLYNMSPKCRVCSIYEYLEYHNLHVRYSFWNDKESFVEKMRSLFKYIMSYKGLNKLLNVPVRKLMPNKNLVTYLPSYLYWETIFCANRAFENGYLEKEERRILLKKLMGFCVLEKDILGLKKYLTIYAGEYDESFRNYIREINLLISEIKEKIAKRKDKDVIVHWVDAVSNDRLREEMPFLYHLSMEKGSMKSEYAYTCMPWTTPTMKTIMTGKDPIEGRLYDIKVLDDEMELLKQIGNKGYEFLYFGNAVWAEKIIPKKYQGFSLDDMRTYISTEYLWNAVNRLAVGRDKHYFMLIHALYETHAPYFCPESDKLRGLRKGQERTASAWMDRQLEFYTGIMGDKSLQIYMGDHGREDEGYAYENKRLNVMFFLRNPFKNIDFSKKMFSLKKFPQLINYLMEWGDVTENEILSEYVISGSYDYYSETHVNAVIGNAVRLNDKKEWMQLKTIRNKEYAYVLYADGEEMFYDLKDETENLIGRPEYAGIIQMLREKLGTEFIDIYQEEFFKRSRKLHEAYKACS